MAYSIYCDGYKVTADDLVAEFNRREIEAPASLRDLLTFGSGYSNQDFDVLSSAIRVLAGGNDILPIYQLLNSVKNPLEGGIMVDRETLADGSNPIRLSRSIRVF